MHRRLALPAAAAAYPHRRRVALLRLLHLLPAVGARPAAPAPAPAPVIGGGGAATATASKETAAARTTTTTAAAPVKATAAVEATAAAVCWSGLGRAFVKAN